MNFQDRVLRLYQLTVARIYRWGMPLVLTISYVTAFLMYKQFSARFFSTIGLYTLHTISGFLFILILIIFLYDKIFQLVKIKSVDLSLSELQENKTRFPGYRKLIIRFFYTFGTATAVAGLSVFGIKSQLLEGIRTSVIFFSSLHQFLGWLFLSIIFVRLYAGLMRRVRNALIYLRKV